MLYIGDIGVLSHDRKFLQTHDDGEIHASNSYEDKEERWSLYEVDRANRVFALRGYYGRYLGRYGAHCVRCVSTSVTATEQWNIISGAPYGLPDLVVFRAVSDGHVMGSNKEGDNTECGGEVAAGGPADPGGAAGNPSWPGWFGLWKDGAVVLDDAGGLRAP